MDSLKAAIEALPRELYDEIFQLTFTPSSSDQGVLKTNNVTTFLNRKRDFAPSACDRIIDEKYKPSTLLQISRVTREMFAKRFLGEGAIFYIHNHIVRQYLNTLCRKHMKQIKEIRVLMPQNSPDTPLLAQASQARVRIIMIAIAISDYGGIRDVVKRSIFLSDGTVRWMSFNELQKPPFK